MSINFKNTLHEVVSEGIEGGLADEKSLHDIANAHRAPIELIQLMMQWGVEVEMEHTDDPNIAKEIAMDHLMEDPIYYKKLKEMEEE